jgi:hypothetical protein
MPETDLGAFRVYVDEDGDLSLACPEVEAIGCLFAAGFVSGTTLAELSAAASKHTGAVAEEAHASLMRMQGNA